MERRHHEVPVETDRRQGERRGRPRLAGAMGAFLKIRITPAQHQRITAVASLNGLDRSSFIRQAIDQAALDCTDDPVFGG